MSLNKYAQTALIAFDYMDAGVNAEQAWEKASCQVFKKGSASQKKGCPKNAFLGLFSNSPSAKSSKNGTYARNALAILRDNPNKSYSVNELWAAVIPEPKVHNSQMDVVLALWNQKRIK